MKLRDSIICPYCEEIDFIEHFFYSCKTVKKLWEEVEKITRVRLGNYIRLELKEVIFIGVDKEKKITSEENISWINNIILVTKIVISKFKYGKISHSTKCLKMNF